MTAYVMLEFSGSAVGILGVYWSLASAQAANPGEWRLSGGDALPTWVRGVRGLHSTWFTIREVATQSLQDAFPGDPIRELAAKAIEGDPMASDAIRDTLRL
jgi:hypothetical protein